MLSLGKCGKLLHEHARAATSEKYLWTCAPSEESDQPMHLWRTEYSLGTFWIAKDANFHHAANEDSDHTAKDVQADFIIRWACIMFHILWLISKPLYPYTYNTYIKPCPFESGYILPLQTV